MAVNPQNPGFRVKVHNLFEADSAPEYWGVTQMTMNGSTMTLVGASGYSNFTPVSGFAVTVLNSNHIEIIRGTTEFPGNSLATPSA